MILLFVTACSHMTAQNKKEKQGYLLFDVSPIGTLCHLW